MGGWALEGIVLAAAASTAWGAPVPPWPDRSAIPSGCLPRELVPEHGRCLFDDQCATGHCSQYSRTCVGDAGLQQGPISDMGDAARLAMLWGVGGARASTLGMQHSAGEAGSTDICNRSFSIYGQCSPYTIGSQKNVIALADYYSHVKAFDPSHENCKCDARFREQYRAGAWTGTFVNGQFKDYCDPVDFQYNRSKAGAANCPVGWERISNASECRTAVAFFAFADNTGSAAQYGSESFPGCVRFTTNNSVVFNGERVDFVGDFELAQNQEYLCKRTPPTSTTSTSSTATTTKTTSTTGTGTATPTATATATTTSTAMATATDTTASAATPTTATATATSTAVAKATVAATSAPPVATAVVDGSLEMAVSDPSAFVADDRVRDAVRETIASVAEVSAQLVSVELRVSRRLGLEAARGRRLTGRVVADYRVEIPLASASGSPWQATGVAASLGRRTSSEYSALVSSSVEAAVGGGMYAVEVTEVRTPQVAVLSAPEEYTGSAQPAVVRGAGVIAAVVALFAMR